MKVFRALLAWLVVSRKAGLFVGRHRTHDGFNRKRTYTFEMPSPMAKRNPDVSKHARKLWTAMSALGDRKTGELAIRGNPLDRKYICREAEIGRYTWLRAIKELIKKGWASCVRERVEHWKDGRKRIVLGRAHYFVHREPQTVKSPMILLKSDSPTVGEPDPQSISKTPYSDCGRRGSSDVQPENEIEEQSSSPTPAPDDDARIGASASPNRKTKPNPFLTDEDEALVREVQARIRAQYPETFDRNKDRVHDALFIFEAIEMIDSRGSSAISVPSAYFAAGVAKILDCDADKLAITDILARKRLLREKYMSSFEATLSPEQEQAMRQFLAMAETKGKPS